MNTEAPITTAAPSVKRNAPASDPNAARLMSLTLRRRNRKSSTRAYRAMRIPYGPGDGPGEIGNADRAVRRESSTVR
jgi:hypothetical protein